MAIIDIKSSNDKFSWIIKKNPETQNMVKKPFQRALRKGEILSWYVQSNLFRSYFKENSSESSFYKNLNNDYLNQGAYNCPYAYCSIINENFSSVLKDNNEDDVITENEIVIHQIFVSNFNILKLFKKHFENIEITETLIENKVFNICFKGNCSLSYLMKLTHILCLIFSMEDKNLTLEINESIAKKYAQYLLDVDAPYFIVYLFNSRLINDFGIFKSIQEMFKNKQWNLYYGNTQKQRYDQIKRVMNGGKLLNDIGCGELYYSRQFKDIYESINAWDADKNIQDRNARFLLKKSINNIELKEEFKVNEMVSNDETDLLITEMLEHIPKDDAINVLKELNKQSFRKLVITLPNKDFNQFYKLGEEFRHDDHCWEPTYDESVDMMKNIFNESLKMVKKIGDQINDISVSTLFVIEKQGENK